MSTASSTTLATSTITTAASTSSATDTSATIALTMTFTPPSPCTSHHLTMVSDFRIWLNEPLPVPGSTFSSCYPSAWIAHYSSVEGSSSSIAPLVTPMVCPSGWDTASSVSQGSLSGYFACCPSGFNLTLPASTAVSTRPFYGGTCYSDFTVGDTITVAKYDSTSLSTTIPFTPKSTDQAFGHPIDGFVRGAVIATATSSSGGSSGTGASAQSSSGAPPGAISSLSSSGGSGLSGGAIAGVVIGVVAGVALLALAAWALLRRRRKASSSAAAAAAAAADASEKDATSPGGASHMATSNEIHGNEVSEMGGEGRQVHEVGVDLKGADGGCYGGPRAEMEGRGVHDVAELDGESPGGGRR
ncbi:hypothetical protein IWX90DRAFT_198306 [Phyllosticta citrichinensis]|uniref:Uncharacterized protein n=1 Tax=Phyllosticta citrichinensis TaxID=1130410 RepID=A0ABR1XXZ3_9PEZI